MMVSRTQRGIALITALLVVALASIAAVAVATAGFTALSRTQLVLDSERAWWYAQGMEAWGVSILEREGRDSQIDHLGEIWAQELPPLPVDGGMLQGRITDAQGRFNINNLAAAQPERAIAILLRLMQCTGAADAFVAPEIVNAIVDWVDSDDEQRFPGGGEDLLYLGLTPPYRVANRAINEISELQAISGVTDEVYARLAPHISALPQETRINVNTATPEVLCALSEDQEYLSRIEGFVEVRDEVPLEQVTLTGEGDLLFPQSEHGITSQDVAVSSGFFLTRAEAFIGNGSVLLYSLVSRPSEGPPIVLRRSTSSQ